MGSEGGYVTSQTCQYIMGNKCPAACGSSWEVPVNGAFAVDPAVTVTCKGTCFTDFWFIFNPILEFHQEEKSIKKIVSDFYIVDTSHCNNSVQDSDETDIDCGGASCDACALAGKCTILFNERFHKYLK